MQKIPGTTTKASGSTGRQLAVIFTCTVCDTRSAKQFTEHAYLHGVVIVRCPGCQNLHLIADRLGWFDDTDSKEFDLQQLEKMTGQKVKRLGGNDDDDGGVWEVNLEDVVGTDKMQQIIKEQEERQQKEDETKNS